MAHLIEKIKVSNGIHWIQINEVGLNVLCGCPADVVKYLIRIGLIKQIEINGVACESGPNAILLSDLPVQNGEFSNLAEFPVLQMLYRQGMILPNHPNNTGKKPLLIGTKSQVTAQMNYIYRGNYGLTSIEEMMKAGIDNNKAKEYMDIKLSFAFGKIKTSDEFLDKVIVANKKTKIWEDVHIKRNSLNVYEFFYKDESVVVDLNLAPEENYQAPFKLGQYHIKRDHFGVIHSGEGDGWDINRPCMGSILMYNNRIYLIDAGPNINQTLDSLGISAGEVEGIFHTHCHDDHFSGLTTLIQSDHRLKYFATSLVKHSVDKKLSALLGTKDVLDRFFKVEILEEGSFNDIEGMEVMPVFSPHPVETTAFYFRVIADKGYKSYFHLADIASVRVLDKMKKQDDTPGPGITQTLYNKVLSNYKMRADIKKIDIGGGIIHGEALDFIDDKSEKKILSHTSLVLTNQEKEIGQRASFGQMDSLILTNSDPYIRFARYYLKAYYHELSDGNFRDILNCPLVTFNPGSILLKQGGESDYFYLTLTGTIEVIHSEKNLHQFLAAGSLIGEMSALLNEPRQKTYVAVGYVTALKIPSNMYRAFVDKFHLLESIKKNRKTKNFLSGLQLFKSMSSSPILNSFSQDLKIETITKNATIKNSEKNGLLIVVDGELELLAEDHFITNINKGDFCFEENILTLEIYPPCSIRAKTDASVYFISKELLSNVPAVLWKLLESYERRLELIISIL